MLEGKFHRLYIDEHWVEEFEKGKDFFSFMPTPPFRALTIWQNLIKLLYPFKHGYRVTVPLHYHRYHSGKIRQRIMITVHVADEPVGAFPKRGNDSA
jgi:hypothetical protein